MDTEKYKSIVTPREVNNSIKKDAEERGRTINTQLKMMAQIYNKLKDDLDPRPKIS